MTRFVVPLMALTCVASSVAVGADDPQVRRDAARALRKATDFFVTQVSTEGGYLWKYSEDLTKREGEATATETTVWVQPPGTPTVGMALLEAYRRTGDSYYLDAAKQAGYCLVRGQLRSGGWGYRIEFDPKRRARYAYRVDPPSDASSTRNTTTLDDNTTQAALRLLMELDKTLEFHDARIHEAVDYAFSALLAVQYPNGAWPQRFVEPSDAVGRIANPSDAVGRIANPSYVQHPVTKASYPASWSRTFPGAKYSSFYTLNDNALADVIDVMFHAARV